MPATRKSGSTIGAERGQTSTDSIARGAQTKTVHQTHTLGAALRHLRRQCGLSLRALAPALHLSFAELSRIERDLKPPDTALAPAAEAVFSAELACDNATGYLHTLISRAVSPAHSRPHAEVHVPAPPSVLIGREAEQEYLRRILPQAGVVTVDGIAGVGKSALVRTAAVAAAGNYRDGVLYADAENSTADDVAHRILGQWLTTLGCEPVPDSVAERADTLVRKVRGKNLLLILENVVRADHVTPLLAAAGVSCTLVITSHRRLRGLALRNGAGRLTVSPLSPETGARLLSELIEPRLADEHDHDLESIARLCGGLPLALHIAAEHLSHYEHVNVAQLRRSLARDGERLNVLSDVTDPDTAVRAVLHRPYQALDPGHRWLFRLLGLHGGPIVTLHGAAALTGQDLDTVHSGLSALADAHLLEPIRPGQWRFHNLVLLLARELVRRTEDPYQRLHAVRRWVSWYLRLVTQVRTASTEEDSSAAHSALDAEAANLPAVTTAAVDHDQDGLARQLMTLLDEIGRDDLVQQCQRTSGAVRRPPTSWMSTPPTHQ